MPSCNFQVGGNDLSKWPDDEYSFSEISTAVIKQHDKNQFEEERVSFIL